MSFRLDRLCFSCSPLTSSRLRNVGEAGSTSARYFSTAVQTLAASRDSSVITQPWLDNVYISVLNPPMWSNSRNVIIRIVWRGSLNLFSRKSRL